MDLSAIKKIYFIGIGGIGMSATAGIAKAKGFDVSGSDSDEIYDPSRAVLDKYKIKYNVGYAPVNMEDADLVVTTAAVDETNPEVAAAMQRNIPIASYPEVLAELVKDKKRIVVVGTHGKGTTSGLISYCLKNLEDSGFFVGAVLTDLKTNFHFGKGQNFVIEGDEYKANFNDNKPKFAYYNPDILLINNIEFDHPDIYPDLDAFKKPFRELARSLNSEAIIIYNADDQNVLDVIADCNAKKIPFSAGQYEDNEADYKLPGKAYAYDYAAALTVLKQLGYEYPDLKNLVREYTGVKRRYEIIQEANPTIIDDYAHHPTAVKATLDASRDKYADRRIVCFFEPHTYSRTKETLAELETAFSSADKVYLAEVYPAREQKLATSITGKEVAMAIAKHHSNVEYVADKADALAKYEQIAQKDDVIVVMAVGSFNTLVYDLQKLK
jgi:UDP-N-acetylmuramate-alanine ligase